MSLARVEMTAGETRASRRRLDSLSGACRERGHAVWCVTIGGPPAGGVVMSKLDTMPQEDIFMRASVRPSPTTESYACTYPAVWLCKAACHGASRPNLEPHRRSAWCAPSERPAC